MSISLVDFIAAQLREAAPDADWNAAGEDRARELATLFTRAGIVNLETLKIEQIPEWDAINMVRRPNDPKNQAELDAISCRREEGQRNLFVSLPWCRQGKNEVATKGRTFTPREVLFMREYLPMRFRIDAERVAGFLGDVNRDAGISGEAPMFKHVDGIPLIGWSSRGKGHVNFAIMPSVKGFTIRPFWGDSSDKKRILSSVAMVASLWGMGFALAGAGSIASALGEKLVTPAFAASYPGVTSAIGNAALNTALTGGDVEAAVKGAVISFGAGQIGMQVGQQVAQVTDIDAFAKVAQAATMAYIQGGDVSKAVGFALLQSLPGAFPSESPEIPSMDWTTPIEANDWLVAADPWGVSSLPGVVSPSPVAMPSMMDFVTPVSIDPSSGGGGGGFWADTREWAGNVFTRENVRAARDVVGDVAAIVATVRAIDNPPQPMPPGQRVAVQNPNQIIRNPNGSLTVSAPDGSVRVIPASQVPQPGAAPMGFQITPQHLAIGGAAIVALVLLARRR